MGAAAADGEGDGGDAAVAASMVQLPEGAPRGLVTELFHTCLFARPPVTSSLQAASAPLPPRCKTDASRAAAFGLLTALCHNCPANLHTLFQFGLLPLEQQFTKGEGWNQRPAATARASCGFVGLKNLGNICYINSIMQQLYMVPALRRGVLSLEDVATEDIGKESQSESQSQSQSQPQSQQRADSRSPKASAPQQGSRSRREKPWRERRHPACKQSPLE